MNHTLPDPSISMATVLQCCFHLLTAAHPHLSPLDLLTAASAWGIFAACATKFQLRSKTSNDFFNPILA